MPCVRVFWQNNFGALLFLLMHLNWVLAMYNTENKISQVKKYEKNNNTWTDLSVVTPLSVVEVSENYSIEASRQRVRRDSSGGKYTDAAKMPQVKVMRLYLQMFKNLWASAYVGGAHPLHHEVPKPVVFLFKDKIAAFFFPNPQKTETEDDKNS